MSKASRKMYLSQLKSGNIKSNKVRVLAFVKKLEGVTIYELRKISNLKHQTLTSVIDSLFDEGLIKISGHKKIPINGRDRIYTCYKFVKTETERNKVSEERKKEKAKRWLENYKKHINYLTEEEIAKYLIKIG